MEFLHQGVRGVETRSYRAIRDYGGWYISYGPKVKAYIIRGAQGVMLTLHDGKNIMVGSKNSEPFVLAMREAVTEGVVYE